MTRPMWILIGLCMPFTAFLLIVFVTTGDALGPGAALFYWISGTFVFGFAFALSALAESRRKLPALARERRD